MGKYLRPINTMKGAAKITNIFYEMEIKRIKFRDFLMKIYAGD